MKKLTYLLSTLFLAFSFAGLRAQTTNPTHAVIATGGLNLRAEASVHGSIVASIPFRGEVRRVDDCLYAADILGTVADYHRWYDGTANVFEDHLIQGNWVKVAYGDREGFVFNTYLWSLSNQVEPDLSVEQHLIIPGADELGMIYDPEVYHFYGIYGRGQREQFELREIQISYLTEVDYYERLLITTKDNKDLRYVIASRRRMQPHRFAGKFFDRPALQLANEAGENNPPEFVKMPGSFGAIAGDDSGDVLINTFIYRRFGEEQVIFTGLKAHAISLDGLGDFDGDGRDDFIVNVAGARGGEVYLFLSSLAEEGELVGLAGLVRLPMSC